MRVGCYCILYNKIDVDVEVDVHHQEFCGCDRESAIYTSNRIEPIEKLLKLVVI